MLCIRTYIRERGWHWPLFSGRNRPAAAAAAAAVLPVRKLPRECKKSVAKLESGQAIAESLYSSSLSNATTTIPTIALSSLRSHV